MSLSIGKSPLTRPPGGTYNFDIEHAAPGHILYLEDVQKRIRGVLAGETIVDTRRGKMLHETGRMLQWHVPREDVRAQVLEPSELRRSDPFKGETNRLDAWFEEDDPIRGHPRDPYHRFDCRHTSEHVLVRVGGEVVAETRRAIKLFETSIPPLPTGGRHRFEPAPSRRGLRGVRLSLPGPHARAPPPPAGAPPARPSAPPARVRASGA